VALKITFVKSGTNSENAVTGDLTLTDGTTVIKRSAFSGGNSFNPLDDGKYRLRLDIRGDEDTDEANTDGTLKPYYGIQKVGTSIPDDQGGLWNGQVEWGTIRARLNPTGGDPDHGDYIHGKKRARDYTHGCICDRSEAILSYLWNMASPPKGVDVVVSGGENFDLETLVKKNVAKKVRSATKATRSVRTRRSK
jgi:hypothetical protein